MIYIIRHGQTNQNKEGRLQGRKDIPLNETGRQEALKAGNYFKKHHIRFDACYSSPLDRAIETAELVTGLTRDQIMLDDHLLEMDYGPYEGISLDHPPKEVVYFFSDFIHHPAPAGMEPLDHVVSRLGDFISHLNVNPDQNVLISTHAIAMKGLLEYLTPASQGAYWNKYIGNCAVYCFEKQKQGFSIPYEMDMKASNSF